MNSFINRISDRIKETEVYLFTHTDTDGRCAGAIAYHHFKNLKKNVIIKEIDYGTDYGLEEIPNDALVIITDFSLEPEQIKELWKKNCRTIWIDHHATAIEKYKKAGLFKDNRLEGIAISDNKSAAYLAWEYFNPNQSMPRAVELVSKFDVWIMEDKATTDAFQIATCLIDDSPTSKDWEELFADDYMVESLIDKGKDIIKFRERFAKEYAKFPVEFEGYSCLACNLSGMGSFAFGDELMNYDFVISFCYDGSEWKYGLYGGKNKEVNLGEIATKYGGGGHAKAAGFKLKELILE